MDEAMLTLGSGACLWREMKVEARERAGDVFVFAKAENLCVGDSKRAFAFIDSDSLSSDSLLRAYLPGYLRYAVVRPLAQTPTVFADSIFYH